MASTARPLLPPDVESRLRAQFGQDVIAFDDQAGHAVATVTPERLHDVVKLLRDDPELAMDYCDFVSAVDRGDDGFELIVHLHSTIHHHDVRLKVGLPHDEPHASSISDLYPGANWHERVTLEMFGIAFDGHPQPVKLPLPEPFEGNPLRKDFVLMTREAKPWPGDTELEEECE